MKGDGDSEVAIVIEDTDMIESTMNGNQVFTELLQAYPVTEAA